MINYVAFLRWWLFAITMLVGIGVAFLNDLFLAMYNLDITKLSIVILLLFVVISIWCGVKTFTVSRCEKVMKNNNVSKEEIEEVDYILENMKGNQEVGWFISDLCLSLGMIGTVIGFIMMLGSFASIDLSDAASSHAIMASLSSGMSVALITTLVGLIASILLKVQYFNLAIACDKVEEMICHEKK